MSLNYLLFAKCLEIFELKVLSSGIQLQCDYNWNESLYSCLPSTSPPALPLANPDITQGYHMALHSPVTPILFATHFSLKIDK